MTTNSIRFEHLLEATELLGLTERFTREQLKAAYRRASRRAHPDRDGGSEQQMSAINSAYELLIEYLDQYRYEIDAREFYRQHPELRHRHQFHEADHVWGRPESES